MVEEQNLEGHKEHTPIENIVIDLNVNNNNEQSTCFESLETMRSLIAEI